MALATNRNHNTIGAYRRHMESMSNYVEISIYIGTNYGTNEKVPPQWRGKPMFVSDKNLFGAKQDIARIIGKIVLQDGSMLNGASVMDMMGLWGNDTEQTIGTKIIVPTKELTSEFFTQLKNSIDVLKNRFMQDVIMVTINPTFAYFM